MDTEKKIKHPLNKLDDVWSSMRKTGSSDIQYILLRHLLGDVQEGLRVDIVPMPALIEMGITPNYLYSALSKGIGKLVTQAYKNSIKESELLLRKEEIIRELRRCLQIAESSSSRNGSAVSTYLDQLRVLEQELEDLHSTNANYKSRVSELEKENQLLSKQVENLSQSHEELSDASTDITYYQHRLREELSEKEQLTGKIEGLEEELKSYKHFEESVLPDLQKLSYCRKHMGKSISLEPSQIEKVIRGYLHGDSNYRISKDLGISHTSIKKILCCDYSTVPSLEKILSALHSVDGNWGTDKKDLLNELIHLYEVRLEDAKEHSKLNFKEVEKSVSSLLDYSKSRNNAN